MSSSPLPRRFLPEPVESSTRSSRRKDGVQGKSIVEGAAPSEIVPTTSTDTMSPQTKPRRFTPQPVEESTRSSHKKDVQHIEGTEDKIRSTSLMPQHTDDSTEAGQPTTRPPRRFAPEAVESTTRSSRKKFAPEPVETTTRSSKDTGTTESDNVEKPKRRFAPQLVETATGSSKNRNDSIDNTGNKPRRKFEPEPVETETRSRRRKQPEASIDYSAEDGPAEELTRTSSGGRKFEPELLETAKGTFRQEVVRSQSKPASIASPPTSPERESVDEVAPLEESRFSAAALIKKHHTQERKHSFMVTDLPTIDSDPSDEEDSDAPSLTNSRSSAESELRQNSKQAAGDSYTDYVLRLAAQNATEQELKDQAMAAYINERQHEPVAHYGFDEDDEDVPIRVGRMSTEKGADIRTFRRSSQDDLDWEMQNMRKHHAQLEEAKRQFKADTAGHSRFSAAALASRHHQEQTKETKQKRQKGDDEEAELAKMRTAASPPMLGESLVFPQTVSPKMTRCDTDHPPRPRTADSDDDDEDEDDGNQPMWSPSIKVDQEGIAGLWMGVCHNDGTVDSRPQTPLRSGIQTPADELSNPFDSHTPRGGHRTPRRKGPRPFSGHNLLPLTPQRSSDSSDAFTSSLDHKLQLEQQIESEFPDRVVTQIYNYLSLGYPTLAWAFDEELSKISKISIDELRKDDDNADAKGYVGVPEGTGTEEADVSGGKCRRWEALRFYVKEWARQSPLFMTEGEMTGKARTMFGSGGAAGARRGSWGH